jgi:hypothetical protein
VSPIAWVASNGFIVLFIVAVGTTAARLVRLRLSPVGAKAAYVAWGELLFYAIGIWFVYTGILHAYFQQIAAPRIGWQPSPFEYELGWMEIPLGVVAMMALWRGYEFRLAATIIAATFAVAAAAGHIQEIVCCANYSPSNAGLVLWFADVFIPVVLVVLAALSTSAQRGASS